MTKDEAYILLNVNSNSSTTEIEEAYKKFYSDYQIRLTNAPTPNLKRLYQKNLNDLELAYNVFKNPTDNNHGELPSSQPVLEYTKSIQPEVNSQKIEKKEISSNSKLQGSEKTKSSGNSKILIFLFIFTLAASVLFGILFFQQNGSFEKVKASHDRSIIVNDSLMKALSPFKNGKFVLKNGGTRPFLLEDYIIVYKAADGTLTKIFDSPNLTINPGQRKNFEKVVGTELEWDGSVIFYSVTVTNADGSSKWAGSWSMEARKDVLNINLDSN